MFRNMGLHVIQNPRGTFSFVGSVPVQLSYTMADGSQVTGDMAHKIAQFGPGLFKSQIKTVTYITREDAINAAAAAGYTVKAD